MTDREAFEAWMFEWYARTPKLNPTPEHVWQAATAATRERCAQTVKKLDKEKWFPSQRDFADACVDEIMKGGE